MFVLYVGSFTQKRLASSWADLHKEGLLAGLLLLLGLAKIGGKFRGGLLNLEEGLMHTHMRCERQPGECPKKHLVGPWQ